MSMRLLILLVASLALTGCGAFDSGVAWRGGPYMLLWIDDPNSVTLSYDRGHGSSTPRVEATVFAVGWDGRFVVAKQHPGANRQMTSFFIIDAAKDSVDADPAVATTGPLTEAEFMSYAASLNLPPFSKELASLK
jgi:hypothetical protein